MEKRVALLSIRHPPFTIRHVFYLCSSVFICGSLFFTACTDTPKTSDQDIKQIDYPKLIEMLHNQTPGDDGFLSFLQQKKNGPTVLLDPRIERKYNAGHLPGAINIPLPQLVADNPQLANAQNIVVYGTGWTDYLSPAAAKKLLVLGYKNVYDFRGGVEFWKAQGGRVEVRTPAYPAAELPSTSGTAQGGRVESVTPSSAPATEPKP